MIDHDSDDGVYCGGEHNLRSVSHVQQTMPRGSTHRCNDDEEVLDHEEDHQVWIMLRRQRSSNVADDFHDCPHSDRGEVPGPVLPEECCVRKECDHEQDDTKKAERK